MFVARDKNTSLKLFRKRPIKKDNVWEEDDFFNYFVYLDSDLFPNLKWEDEPIEVEIVKK